MLNAIDVTSEKEMFYQEISREQSGFENDRFLATLLAAKLAKTNVLPDRLGLSQEDYAQMLARHFPGFNTNYECEGENKFAERQDEIEDLIKLMLAHRAHNDVSEVWIATIIAVACMGDDHLWQDLGLWSRKDLSDMISQNFPSLAAKNDRNMKWKRFLYKQLCIQEGIYTCRAPSCEVCTDYQVCFGPET